MRTTSPQNPRIRAGLAAAAIAVVSASVLAPAAAFAAQSDHGGAARSPEDNTAAIRASLVNGPAKNVILIIGDGMGDSEITVARDYEKGAGGQFEGLDALPLTGQYTTYSLYPEGSPLAGKPDYVPDSAATGTAWATGTKSYDNAIGVDIFGQPHDNLLELAKANGLRTGDVTTTEIQDATPAVQVAHVAQRACYDPTRVAECGDDALDQGGLGSISEQLLDTRPDVTLGGGAQYFETEATAGQWAGETLFAQAEARGYQVARSADDLAAVTAADQQSPVLGLFAPGNFPTRYAPTIATVGGADQAPVTCTENEGWLGAGDSGLALGDLTEKAISLLDDPESEQGFFLQIESGSIDKQDHSADACGQIGETVEIDEAIQAALDFASVNEDTLVIVTADHAHTSQIVDSTPPGLSIALTTKEGSPMKVSYGTSPAGGSQQHTGAQLRIAAYGPGAANVVGLTDQTDTFFTIANALELDTDLAALSDGAAVTLPKTEFQPGEAFELELEGFNGDRQVTGVMQSDPVDLGRTDVLSGAATIAVVAPEELGAHSVTIAGAQSDKTVTVDFTVVGGSDGTGGTGEGEAGGGGTVAGGSGPGLLSSTGAVVAPYLTVAALLIGVGAIAYVVARRRRAGHAGD